MKLAKIHKILKFKQSDWMKVHIDFNTNKKNAVNNFEKDFFKLMINSVYYSRWTVRSRMTINVHSFWLLILKVLYIRVQKNLHSLFSLWSKFHNGGSKVLTKQFFRNRSSDTSFEQKFYADQEFQLKHQKCKNQVFKRYDVKRRMCVFRKFVSQIWIIYCIWKI